MAARKAKHAAGAAEPAGAVLPVWLGREAIVERVRAHDTVVLVGETGSGKTTQIPQFLMQAGLASPRHTIIVTLPRRVAATSLARRVAAELGCADPATISPRSPQAAGSGEPPELVGYSVRFDERSNRNTVIRFATDGMLIREVIGRVGATSETDEPHVGLLKRCSVLILDEAHERSLRTDMLLGLAKKIQRERRRRAEAGEGYTPLKVVVMSATIDAEAFARFFGAEERGVAPTAGPRVPILYVAGRQHTVRLFHTEESCQDWTDAAVRTVLQLHVAKPRGDILVFATGQEEIEAMAQSLQTYAAQLDAWARAERRAPVAQLQVRPLYAALGPAAQAAVFAPTPPDARKVVLATNIAETSITIPGIRYVVDSGLAKEKVYAPHTGIEALHVQPIAQASAAQRAGRAGREAAGECYRLYTRDAYEALRKAPVPEIHRTDLAGAALQLYAMGLDPFTFEWLDPPDTTLLREAVLHLAELDAVEMYRRTSSGLRVRLTPLGAKMAVLPMAPAYARMLLAAAERGPSVARQARDLVSVLSADRGLFLEPHDPDKREAADRAREAFLDPSGDHATCLRALYAYLTVRAAGAGAKHELRMWCQAHFVHERTIRNVLAIRKQLMRICATHGIPCDDEASRHEPAAASEADDADPDALTVVRGGGTFRAPTDTQSYTELISCLATGRLSHTALRQPDGTYRRIAGGQAFKLHPSCTLHPSRSAARGAASLLPPAIVFEELVLTSQTFARTVSRIEPAWLQEAVAGNKGSAA